MAQNDRQYVEPKDTLPIQVNVLKLFDLDDPKTAAMIERVNAWINFRALGANWFVDESNITTIDITLLPESDYLQSAEHSNPSWKQTVGAEFTGIQNIDTNEHSFVCIAAISNTDIKEMMDDGRLVESNLQSLVLLICNYLTLNQPLSSL